MINQQQSTEQMNERPVLNRFVGKKIENTLTFNIGAQLQSQSEDAGNIQSTIQTQSNKSQAIPLSFAINQKRIPSKVVQNQPIPNVSQVDKSKSKSKNNTSIQGNGANSQQISQYNLSNIKLKQSLQSIKFIIENLIQEQQRFKKEDQNSQNDEHFKNQMPISLQERRQQKKLEQMQTENCLIKKDISIIQQATNVSNLSSDCEEFVDIMVPKKNRLSHLQVQQHQTYQAQQTNLTNNYSNNNEQQNQEKEMKKQADIDEMIRKSNMKYKTDKEIMEIQKQQKQQETQKLKEKLKKQEEEIRKRNQQKTQQFKDKKKRKEKEQQIQKQEQQQQQQQKRGKSIPKQTKQQQQQQQSQQGQQISRQSNSQQNTSREYISTQKPDISKEQFDLATKNRVKEMMKKQKEEKERLEEEKEKKKLKLEILRQEQLIQLQKAKVKTIEQEEQDRKAQIVKRPGGGSYAPQQQQDRRDSRQSLHQRVQQEQYSNYYEGGEGEEYNQEEEEEIKYNQEQEDDEDLSLQNNQYLYQQQQHQQVKSQRDKSFKQKKPPQQSKITSATKNRPQSSAGVKNNAQKNTSSECVVSDSFLKENIHASIKQLYPNCSLEELIQLEEEYRREFIKESKQQKKLNNFKPKQNLPLNRPKSASSKKPINGFSDFEKLKKKQLSENKQELQKLLELKKLDDFDIDSVKNPIEMIENLKDIANQIEEDIDANDRKFGIGKYKQKKASHTTSVQSTTNQSKHKDKYDEAKQEIAKLEKEAYFKELYLNAQNTFNPQEMQEFETYLENHMVNGEIILTSEEEDNDDNNDDSEEEGDNEGNYNDSDEEEEDKDDVSDQDEEYQQQRVSHNQPNAQIKYNVPTKEQQNQQKQPFGSRQTLPKKQPQNGQKVQQRNNFTHSKSVQDMNNKDSDKKRGRSQDPKAPKSCLIKQTKPTRSKTVTFDKSFVRSDQNSNLQTSPSIHQKKEKYDFNEFDDFNERDIEGSNMMAAEYSAQEKNKENYSNSINSQKLNNYKQNEMQELIKQQEEEHKKRFEKKIQDLKELSEQYSGEKKKSIDASNLMSSLECSASSNLRLSHLKSQNVPSSFVQNETPKQQSINQFGTFMNKQGIKQQNQQIGLQMKQNSKQELTNPNGQQEKTVSMSNVQNQQQFFNNQAQKPQSKQNISSLMKNNNNDINNYVSKENTNTQNIPLPHPQQKMNNLKMNNQKQQKDSQPSPIQITQSSPQALSNIPTEFESDFLNFNEQFDIDTFKSQLTQDDFKQLIHVNNLDLKSFFTNEKLNSVPVAQDKQFVFSNNKQQNQHQMNSNPYDDDEDDDDEGLFANESPKNYKNNKNKKLNKKEEISSSMEALNYYEKNKGSLLSNEKTNNKQFNNFMMQEDAGALPVKRNQINENEYQPTYSTEFNKQFLDDDKLFALSATDLLKFAEKNTNLQK